MNVINDAGILAISTRLHRLSEQLRKDGAMIYQTFGIDFGTQMVSGYFYYL